jgi:chromosome segregation ATPase
MSDDPAKKLPGEQDGDRISALISAVQSISTDFKEVSARLEALEKTVNERMYDTKPIWERALAEIAETRAELKAEIAELRSEMRDGFRTLGSKMDVLNEDVLTVRAEQRLLGKRVQDLESKAS